MRLKSTILVSLFFFGSIAIAQANNLPITVAANESITVTLFFPSEIKKVIKPAVNYKFDYEQYGTMGTLVARKGATSNLTVITKDGSIFSFLLQYHQEVANFTYVLSTDQAIGRMEPVGKTTSNATIVEKETNSSSESEPLKSAQREEVSEKKERKKPQIGQKSIDEEPMAMVVRSDFEDRDQGTLSFSEKSESEASESELPGNTLYDTDRESYYDIFCENNYDQETRLKKDFKAGTGIELRLNALTADKNEFYFIFQVTNRLTSKFSANELQFYVRSAPKDEPLQITPVHVFNHHDQLEAGRTKKMVYVFKNFRLSGDQKVFAVLNEKEGDRNTVLHIDSRTINAIGEKTTSAAR